MNSTGLWSCSAMNSLDLELVNSPQAVTLEGDGKGFHSVCACSKSFAPLSHFTHGHGSRLLHSCISLAQFWRRLVLRTWESALLPTLCHLLQWQTLSHSAPECVHHQEAMGHIPDSEPHYHLFLGLAGILQATTAPIIAKS